MAMESMEMNGDADRNGEAEVREGGTGAQEKKGVALASSSQIKYLYFTDRALSRANPRGTLTE